MRPVTLASLKTGVTRLRDKGGANPQTLYDLVNGYVDESGAPVSRPGFRRYHAFPIGSNTKGLATYKQRVVVFASTVVNTGSASIDCFVLRHPTSPGALLREIHYARPIAGALYVVAEFNDGDVFHYWMRGAETWQPNTIYRLGQLLQPTTPNGYVYEVGRIGTPYPLWEPNVEREVGEQIEPTVSDGFYYEVVEVAGTNPRSGATEPDWNDEDGAYTYEDVDNGDPSPPPGTGPITATPIVDPENRYGNPGGSRPPDYRREQ